MKEPPDLPVVGWREWISLPGLGVERIKAKLDTGARSSSIHVYDLEEFRRGGRAFVRFSIHPLQRDTKTTVRAEAEVLEYRKVRSSSGHTTRRPVIRPEISLLGRTWRIELTLARRDEMGFRMLLGREAVRGRFFVDPGTSFYGGRPRRKKKAKKKKKTGKKAGTKTARTRRRSTRGGAGPRPPSGKQDDRR